MKMREKGDDEDDGVQVRLIFSRMCKFGEKKLHLILLSGSRDQVRRVRHHGGRLCPGGIHQGPVE